MKKITTVKELMDKLRHYSPNTQVLVSNDEEMNTVHWGFEVCTLELDKENNKGTTNAVLIFPLSGQEIKETF